MENTKTDYQYLHDDGNWYPIEIRKCNMTRARGTISEGCPYQPVYIKDGRERSIRYRRPTVESAIAELYAAAQHGDGIRNSRRYRLVPDTVDVPEEPELLRLFVYGTLKRGYWNHDRFCSKAVSIEKATVSGQLYELPSGIPVLVVPEKDILAVGSNKVEADVRMQNGVTLRSVTNRSSKWDIIKGEIITLADPAISLPPIDRLEGFHPGHSCLYTRVLLPAKVSSAITTAWCYAASADPPHCARLLHACQWVLSNQ